MIDADLYKRMRQVGARYFVGEVGSLELREWTKDKAPMVHHLIGRRATIANVHSEFRAAAMDLYRVMNAVHDGADPAVVGSVFDPSLPFPSLETAICGSILYSDLATAYSRRSGHIRMSATTVEEQLLAENYASQIFSIMAKSDLAHPSSDPENPPTGFFVHKMELNGQVKYFLDFNDGNPV